MQFEELEYLDEIKEHSRAVDYNAVSADLRTRHERLQAFVHLTQQKPMLSKHGQKGGFQERCVF